MSLVFAAFFATRLQLTTAQLQAPTAAILQQAVGAADSGSELAWICCLVSAALAFFWWRRAGIAEASLALYSDGIKEGAALSAAPAAAAVAAAATASATIQTRWCTCGCLLGQPFPNLAAPDFFPGAVVPWARLPQQQQQQQQQQQPPQQQQPLGFISQTVGYVLLLCLVGAVAAAKMAAYCFSPSVCSKHRAAKVRRWMARHQQQQRLPQQQQPQHSAAADAVAWPPIPAASSHSGCSSGSSLYRRLLGHQDDIVGDVHDSQGGYGLPPGLCGLDGMLLRSRASSAEETIEMQEQVEVRSRASSATSSVQLCEDAVEMQQQVEVDVAIPLPPNDAPPLPPHRMCPG